MDTLETKAQKLEKILKLLNTKEINLNDQTVAEMFPELVKMREENDRLKYRCGILEKSVVEASSKKSDQKTINNVKSSSNKTGHYSIIGYMKDMFDTAIKKAYPSHKNFPVVISEATKENFGDYQCNSAMAISQILNKAGEKTNPKKVAETIVASLEKCDLIEKVNIEGPGFINMYLNKSEICRLTSDLLLSGIDAPYFPKKRCVIDFSSPNIAKQMHVGHLRSTVIGEAICRFYEFLGFDVLRLNHVGDWGTQFGMLIAHLNDRFPDYATKPPPIGDLQAFYKESKARFDENKDDFKKRAYDCVVRLQSGEPDITYAWKVICEISRKEFQTIYDRLDISLIERGESFYQNRMKQVIEELEAANMIKEEEGRKLVFVEGFDTPLTVVKSDGGFTYDTSDIATIRQRCLEEKGDIVLYVVDAGQNLHLELVFAVARKFKWYDPDVQRVEHIQFGVVLGEDKKKFKTRSGETVRLSDLLDEGLKRCEAKLIEKERDKALSKEEFKKAQEAVAYGCIKYADLSHNRTSDYVFSFDKMLDDRGNTAAYLLYAYTRIRSVGRNAGIERQVILDFIRKSPLTLQHVKEFKLAKTILKFYDTILQVANTLLMHQLCDFLYDLATVFTEFYDNCYCIEKKNDLVTIHYDRLALCEITADVTGMCFAILGIRTVEKM